MTTDYLLRLINNPATPRTEYLWAWNILQQRQQQHARAMLARG